MADPPSNQAPPMAGQGQVPQSDPLENLALRAGKVHRIASDYDARISGLVRRDIRMWNEAGAVGDTRLPDEKATHSRSRKLLKSLLVLGVILAVGLIAVWIRW